MINPFTRIPNEIIRDPRLSLQAKGAYAVIASKPEGWDFSVRRLAGESKNGYEALQSAVRELEFRGYLTRQKQPSGKVLWVLCHPETENPSQANPETQNPSLAEPETEKPKDGKSLRRKTRLISNTEKKVILNSGRSHFPEELKLISEEIEHPAVTLPTRSGNCWPLRKQKLTEYQNTFPRLNVEAEIRKARQWLIDNPSRRKTAQGMPKFLLGWLMRADGKPVTPGIAQPSNTPPSEPPAWHDKLRIVFNKYPEWEKKHPLTELLKLPFTELPESIKTEILSR